MNRRTMTSSAVIASSMLVTSDATAVYLGLQVFGQRITLQDGTVMNQYRVYGYCSDPGDYVKTVAGSTTLGNLVLQSRNVDDTGSGSIFYNAPGGGATAPTLAAIALNPDVAHDTFVTIGISIAEQGSGIPPNPPDEIILSPGFNGIGNVNELNTNSAAWFTVPVPQSQAGYLGDGDPLLRVLLMQLTVSSTSNVRGTVTINGITNTPLAGGTIFTVTGQTFNSIPAPGAWPLIGLAMIANRRRRRALSVTYPAPTESNRDDSRLQSPDEPGMMANIETPHIASERASS